MKNQSFVCTFGLLMAVVLVGPSARAEAGSGTPPTTPAAAQSGGITHNRSEHGDLGKIGVKLANPTSDVWALFTQFGFTFSDGDDNSGASKLGGKDGRPRSKGYPSSSSSASSTRS